MKQGKTLQELAVEVDRQAKAIKDYRADARDLAMKDSELVVSGSGRFAVNDLAHSQIATRLAIPQKYYDSMRADAKSLLDINVNYWFQTSKDRRLVRTLDNRVRAFLSTSYRPLDNYKLVETVLPKLQKLNATIESSEITERHLYIKAVFGQIEGEVKKGDIVRMGVIVSNSEVGCGSLKIEPMIYRLACLNGLVVADSGVRKYHVGRRDNEDDAQEYYRDRTRMIDDKAFWMKCKDVIDATITRKSFDQILGNMRKATEVGPCLLGKDPAKAVEELANKYRFSESEQGGVLSHLIKGGDLSNYGFVQAITRTSQDLPDYERATEFERIGGEILNLN